MYEDDLFPPDQVGIFKGVVAELQAINLTASTTWNTLLHNSTLDVLASPVHVSSCSDPSSIGVLLDLLPVACNSATTPLKIPT